MNNTEAVDQSVTVIQSPDTDADQVPSSDVDTNMDEALSSVTVSNDCNFSEELSMTVDNVRQVDKIYLPMETAGMNQAAQTNVSSITKKQISSNIAEKTETIQTKMSSWINDASITVNSGISCVNVENIVGEINDVEISHQLTLVKKSERNKYKNKNIESNSFAVNLQQSDNIFKGQSITQKEYFECICGATNKKSKKWLKVQCTRCTLWQHAHCVNYDLNDPYRGNYRCPHCHVSSVSNVVIFSWILTISMHLMHKYECFSLELFILYMCYIIELIKRALLLYC